MSAAAMVALAWLVMVILYDLSTPAENKQQQSNEDNSSLTFLVY